jgi:hypothetical protein
VSVPVGGGRERKGRMIIEESIEIQAPLPVVWGVFSRMEDWKEWNSVCRSCSLPDGKDMKSGVCFAFTLRPYFVPIKISPRITRCEPGREVVWEGGRLGVMAEHRFTFHDGGDSVRLESCEVFVGPLLWLCRLLFIPRVLHRLSSTMLHQIKVHSERYNTQSLGVGAGGAP